MKKARLDPAWKGKEKKKKKKITQCERRKKKKKKKKKPNSPKPVKKKKKGQKLRLGTDHGTFSVGLIMEMPLKTELWKLKTHFRCFQFP